MDRKNKLGGEKVLIHRARQWAIRDLLKTRKNILRLTNHHSMEYMRKEIMKTAKEIQKGSHDKKVLMDYKKHIAPKKYKYWVYPK